MSKVSKITDEIKRNYFLPFILLASTLLTVSCTVSLSCEIYNNTNTQIKVTQRDKYGVETTHTLMHGESLTIEDWEFYVYEISAQNRRWVYDPPMATVIPSDEYIASGGFGPFFKRTIHAQLNSDGAIYLIKKGQKFPVSELPGQPDGYPLQPIKR